MIANENLENLFSISNFQQVMFNIKKLMIIFTSFLKFTVQKNINTLDLIVSYVKFEWLDANTIKSFLKDYLVNFQMCFSHSDDTKNKNAFMKHERKHKQKIQDLRLGRNARFFFKFANYIYYLLFISCDNIYYSKCVDLYSTKKLIYKQYNIYAY